jgi:hypothetical protein
MSFSKVVSLGVVGSVADAADKNDEVEQDDAASSIFPKSVLSSWS